MRKSTHVIGLVASVFLLSNFFTFSPKSTESFKTQSISVYDDITNFNILSVHDGDTFKIDIKDWPEIIGKNINIRIAGIDTPELYGPDKEKAKEARLATKKILDDANVIILTDIKRDKYFRIIATVIVDGCDIADILIKQGFAKPYDGGTK